MQSGCLHSQIAIRYHAHLMRRGTPRRLISWLGAATGVCALATACDRGTSSAPPAHESPDTAVAAWRAKHEADYRRDWVSIAGLHTLEPGPNSAGSAATNDIVLPASTPATIGRFVLDEQRVRFEPA